MAINRAILAIIAFGFIVGIITFIIIPISNEWVSTQPIWVHFLFFYFLIFSLISITICYILSNKLRAFRIASSLTFIVIALDLVLPSYAVDSSGHILESETIGYFGCVDYVVGSFWAWVGINGVILAFFTYVVTGMLFLLIALWLMGKGKFLTGLKRLFV